MAKIFIIAGLMFGDEGKGTMVDYLTRRHNAELIVRYNGGSQAAHNVEQKCGLKHLFSQFGSGTLFAKTGTFLSQYILFDPLSFMKENEVLKAKGIADAASRVAISDGCLIVAPFQKIINRMREISRGDQRRGSCGMGIGETVKDARSLGQKYLKVSDLLDRTVMKNKIDFLWRWKADIAEQIAELQPNNRSLEEYLAKIANWQVDLLVDKYSDFVRNSGVQILPEEKIKEFLERKEVIIFEGAQGALLDEKKGFQPFITPSQTTFVNAEEIISESGLVGGDIERIGVLRAYATRHGPGPFITEDGELTRAIPDTSNVFNEWQGEFRIGWFDLVAVRYALAVNGETNCIALTNIDRIRGQGEIKVCDAYRYEDKERECFKQFFEYKKTKDGLIIKKIKLVEEPTVEHQTRLTEFLQKCRPIYKVVKNKEYVNFLEQQIGLPIKYLSFGPTAEDKIEK